MSAEFKKQDSALIIAIDGEIDHHETKNLRVDIDREIERSLPDKIIFDFSRTAFMDSSGLGLILGRYRKARERGVEVEIVNPGDKISRILKMAGIDKFITVKGVEK